MRMKGLHLDSDADFATIATHIIAQHNTIDAQGCSGSSPTGMWHPLLTSISVTLTVFMHATHKSFELLHMEKTDVQAVPVHLLAQTPDRPQYRASVVKLFGSLA